MKAQLKELIDRYHPEVMWLDGDWCANKIPPTLTDWWNKNNGQDLYDYMINSDSATRSFLGISNSTKFPVRMKVDWVKDTTGCKGIGNYIIITLFKKE